MVDEEYDFGEEVDSEEESRFRRGRNYYIDDYVFRMASIFNIAATPYDEGKYCNIEQFKEMVVKVYDTKVVLCGDYVRVINYTYPYETMRYDSKTGKVKKFYADNSSNKKDKTVNFAYANADVFKTYITLSFAENVSYDEAISALNDWLANSKGKSKGFKYYRVIGKGKINKRIHFHLLTSLDVDIDTSMFVKADVKTNNVYNLKNWKIGFSKVNKIRMSEDLTYIASYIGGHLFSNHFTGKRIMSKSNDFIYPKTFYFDSRVDQKKIDVLTKDAMELSNYKFKDHFGSDTRGKIFKRNALETDVFEYPSFIKKYKKAEGTYGIDKFASADLSDMEPMPFDEDDASVVNEVEKVAIYMSNVTAHPKTTEERLSQLKMHCELMKYDVVKIFMDRRSRELTIRPEYKKLMARMKKGRFKKIVAFNIQAISINPIELDSFKKDVIEHDCKFETVLDNNTTQLMMHPDYKIW